MTGKRRFIPVEEAAKEWMKDPEFRAEYDALEEEFALASALIHARSEADMTQEEVARAMGTTQAVVARLRKAGASCPRRGHCSASPRRRSRAYASASIR